MEKRLTLSEIRAEVRELTQFEQKVEELEKMVHESKTSIVFVDPTLEQLEIVKRGRIELRKIEIEIEKMGKEFRDIFTSTNKEILSKQRELTSITSPEIERLSKIEEVAHQKEIMRKREMLLPERMRRLDEISTIHKVDYNKSELLEMDSTAFEVFYNVCVSNELQLVKQEFENKKRIEDEEKIKEFAKQQEELDEQRKIVDDQRRKIEQEQRTKQDKIDEENREIEKEKVKLAHQKEMQEAETIANKKALDDIEIEKKKKEKERITQIELQENRKRYVTFLKKNGWTDETRDDYETRVIEGGYELWHKVGKFIEPIIKN